jgi:predicted acetyltransferase
MHEGSQRTQIIVQHRWKTIQKEVNKFCAYLSEIERRNESEKVAEDWVTNVLGTRLFW